MLLFFCPNFFQSFWSYRNWFLSINTSQYFSKPFVPNTLYQNGELVWAAGHFRGGAPSWMLDRILNETLSNSSWVTLVQINAASSLPSLTPGTQGLTHLLGRQEKHVWLIVRRVVSRDLSKSIRMILTREVAYSVSMEVP